MSLMDELNDYINAAFTGLWVQTHEPDEAEREITRHAAEQHWKLVTWDIANGLRLPAGNGQPDSGAQGKDPLAALRLTLLTAAVTLACNVVFGLAASWLIATRTRPTASSGASASVGRMVFGGNTASAYGT